MIGAGTNRSGGVVSTTVTVDVHRALRPQSSVAVNVTVVTVPGAHPDGKSAGASSVTTTPPQTSEDVAESSHAATTGSELVGVTRILEMASLSFFGAAVVALFLRSHVDGNKTEEATESREPLP